ncbi:MAG: hypothetical protein SGILL_001245 [Bacillariaceae sp.]
MPVELVGGWTTAAICLKHDNAWQKCITADNCAEHYDHRTGVYCSRYEQQHNGNFHKELSGHDLGTAVFYKTVTDLDAQGKAYKWDLRGSRAGWAVMVGIRDADPSSPIRGWAGITCDKEPQSRFPSVSAKAGDLLLLHQGFDDRTTLEKFGPPDNTETVAWEAGDDETALLFEYKVTKDGETGEFVTTNEGGPTCKDVQVSVAIGGLATPSPTAKPTTTPTKEPTTSPSSKPTTSPSTDSPSTIPSDKPSTIPSEVPSSMPTDAPRKIPIRERLQAPPR